MLRVLQQDRRPADVFRQDEGAAVLSGEAGSQVAGAHRDLSVDEIRDAAEETCRLVEAPFVHRRQARTKAEYVRSDRGGDLRPGPSLGFTASGSGGGRTWHDGPHWSFLVVGLSAVCIFLG
jgi:hypothetical protein